MVAAERKITLYLPFQHHQMCIRDRGLVGVFCILDSRILGRMNFERPLITCTIVGALLGRCV